MRIYALILLLPMVLLAQACQPASSIQPNQPSSQSVAGYTKLDPLDSETAIDTEVMQHLQSDHYQPVTLNNKFSEKFLNAYVDDLDGGHSVFLQSDIDRFRSRYKDQFDNDLKSGDLNAAFDIFNTYEKRRIGIDRWLLGRLKKGVESFDLGSDETFNVDREKAPWPADEAARHALWTKQLKTEIISMRLSDVATKDIQKRLTERYKNELKQLGQAEPGDAFSAYMDAYTHSYDPHTDYFSPRRSEDFSIDINLQLQGIGAQLRSHNGYPEIVRLIPGGPAAKSGKFKPTDRIVAVGQGQSGDLTDVVGMRLDEAVRLIRGKAGTTVRLQVLPADNGPTKTINLVRAKIKLKDQAASKQVLHVKRGGQSVDVGVITLPSFYNGTSADIAKLVKALKKQQVAGIVIDLRNNGGGSLEEVNKMIGLFMPPTPTVQIRDANGHIQELGDGHQPIYKGPMAVMVNRLSASASEIFAGAMKDMGRAVLVGSQTFGKGTVQALIPLSSGKLKLTEAKFYRVSGKSTQERGVTPDVAFPRTINPKQIGEDALPNHLPWDKIAPTRYPRSDAISQIKDRLIAMHKARVADDPDFQYRIKRIALARKVSQDKTLSLNLKKRQARQNQLQQKQLALANAHRKAIGKRPFADYQALDDSEDLDSSSGDDSLPPAHKDSDKPDAYQKETAQILLDMIDILQGEQQQQAA